MSDHELERREQAAKQRAVEMDCKLTKNGAMYVLLTESDAPLASGPLEEIEAVLAHREAESEVPDPLRRPAEIRRACD